MLSSAASSPLQPRQSLHSSPATGPALRDTTGGHTPRVGGGENGGGGRSEQRHS